MNKPLDMPHAWATVDAVPVDLPAVVLMTHVNPRTVSYQQALETLAEGEIAVFDTSIKNLETIKSGANTLPKDLAGYDLMAQELNQLIGCKN